MTTIEKVFKEKCEIEASKIYSSWELQKEQIEKYLSTVITIFPHYSLHDASHSETILEKITLILGEVVIKNLSISNLWLILMSAYCHDLGMICNDYENVISNEEFINLIKEIQKDENNYHYKYANCFQIKDNKLYTKFEEFNSISLFAPKYLLALYFRGKHADRSVPLIMNLAKSSTNAIQERHYSLLGKICNSHVKDFSEVMKLPLEQTGFYTDVCNPRFVSCLLRIGDLLDIENNRFSEIVWNSLPVIPLDSEFHKGKHHSIEEIYISDEYISMKSVVNNMDVLDLVNKAFVMLDKEFDDQRRNWNEIIPKNLSYQLPFIKELYIDMENLDTIDGKKVPQFTVNSEKALELLQGDSIYKDKFQAIREIIQNAVDATLLKVFIKNNELDYKGYKEQLKTEQLIISINENKEIEIEGKTVYSVTIEDFGIGMDKEDLKYLFEVASSSNNENKNKIINKMPTFLKPSGSFGLGFQSIFMLCDKVEIETRKLNTSKVYKLTLLKPNGNSYTKTLISSKDIDVDYAKESGTKISFKYICNNQPNKIYEVKTENEIEVMTSYDFIKDNKLEIEYANLLSNFISYGRMCPVKVVLRENETEYILPQIFFDSFSDLIEIDDFAFQLNPPEQYGYKPFFFYRNQRIEHADINTRFLQFGANILSHNAKEILSVDRNSLKNNEITQKLKECIIKKSGKYLIAQENYSKFNKDSKVYVSMYLNYYKKLDYFSDLVIPDEIVDIWKDYKLSCENENITIGSLINKKINVNIIGYTNSRTEIQAQKISDNEITISVSSKNDDILHFIVMLLLKEGYIPLFKTQNNYEFIKQNNGINDYIKDFKSLFKADLQNALYYKRGLIPCNSKYKDLAIKQPDNFYGFDIAFSWISSYLNNPIPYMVSPFERIKNLDILGFDSFQKTDLKDIVAYTLQNKQSSDSSIDENKIKNLYEEFIRENENIISEVNDEVKNEKSKWIMKSQAKSE